MFSAMTQRFRSDRTRWMALLGALVVVLLASVDAYAHGVAEGDKGFIQESSGVLFLPFVYLGAKHMVTGYDHLPFLFGVIFQAAPAGSVGIKATVGSTFPTPEVLVAAERLDRLVATGTGKPKIRVVGSSSTALNLEVTGARPGLLVTAVTTKPRDVEYTEDRIPLILEEYRVRPEAVAAVDNLTRPRTWRVSSRRFAKTFVCVQRCNNRSVGQRASGTDLEFVGQGSSAYCFRLLRKGSALANYPVDLVGVDGKRQHLSTDERGEVRLPPASRGTMMLFAAFLVPPTGSERFILDLSSLTFAAR